MCGLQNKAQTTLELTLSLVVIVMLLVAMLRLFFWASHALVGREKAYIKDFHNAYEAGDVFSTPANQEFYPGETNVSLLP